MDKNSEYVRTWVEGPLGRRYFVLDPIIDNAGLYAMFVLAGSYHGAERPEPDPAQLPIIREWDKYSEKQLLKLVRCHVRDYNAVCFCVAGDASLRRKLIQLWARDLAGIDYEGDVVPGLPNSVKAGIMRGQGYAMERCQWLSGRTLASTSCGT